MKLSRERILETALAVVEREGWDALSMRRLAQDLDVWPMAIYRHFRDKEELLAVVAVAAADRIPTDDAAGGWEERLAGLVRAVAGTPAARAGGGLPGGARLTGEALAILAEAGFPPAGAVVAWRTAFAYAAGFDPDPAPPAAFAELDDVAPRAVAELARPADFEAGLSVVLAGIDALRR
ncbi:MAG TPA: helix-turn-helix domain-containing protein [Solirubrobacteraceae bacterium]|nr:helix-turn-helix domain-containing protein [Solirubrobacteraceae bacterium]